MSLPPPGSPQTSIAAASIIMGPSQQLFSVQSRELHHGVHLHDTVAIMNLTVQVFRCPMAWAFEYSFIASAYGPRFSH